MPRASYDPAVKDAFIKAASDARRSKKSWGEAHSAASEAGYQGSMQGIVKLLRAQTQRKGKAGRKPGRPAGSKNAGRAPVAISAASVSSDLAGLIGNLVASKINDALDRAIGILQNAKA